MSESIQDLIGEREDAKRQREIIVKDTIRVNNEIVIAKRQTRGVTRTRLLAELYAQRTANAEALTQLDRRLAELKRLIHANQPVTFSSAFYRAAKEILANETFETIRVRAEQYVTTPA